MPVTPTYPGVYIQEIPSGVRTITGVATSITAFIGTALKGPVDFPVRVQNYGEFERQFGGLWIKSAMSYAVQQYFLNGGSDALIIRAVNRTQAKNATTTVGGLNLAATSPGKWINDVFQAKVTHPAFGPGATDNKIFNLEILQIVPGETQPIVIESFRNLSTDPDSPRYVEAVLKEDSTFVDVTGAVPAERPANNAVGSFTGGVDGEAPPSYTDFLGNEGEKTGLYALEKADLFNLLCIPPNTRDAGNNVIDGDGFNLLSEALRYCKKRRAMLIVDPPTKWDNSAKAVTDLQSSDSNVSKLRDENSVIYFPRIKMADPLKENRIEEFPPCGVVAGIMARTDAERGVWKAPAGIDATLTGVRQLGYKLTDGENGQLNPLGVNCLRSFPVYGNIVWGARTLEGADQLASEWKYLPVRRFTLFLQESLYRGTQWVVFEPNDEPLWAQIRLNIGAFMNNLFRQGAFQGKSPKEAYFVKCDSETTTQNDINLGIVNIVVGFAPLKPAEFVIIKFQQMAGQIAT